MRVRKIIKRTLIALLSLIILILIAIALAINFIFTPEKITPTVTELLNENLDAEVACERIELTFFSTFPHFGIKLKNGSVITHADKSSKADTLAQFDFCKASFNVEKLWKDHDLEINKLLLVNPKIKAVIHKNGTPNWDIVPDTEADTVTVKDTTAFKINHIHIKKLNVENAKITYRDYETKTRARIDSLTIAMKVSNTDNKLLLSTETSGRNISFAMGEYRFMRNKKADFKTDIYYDKKNHKVDFAKSELRINDIDFITEGHFRRDTVTHELYTDLELEMKVPSLKTLWDAIPEHIVQKEDIEVQGNVALTASAKGVYSKDRLPVFDVLFKIDHGVLKYKKFPGEIRHLEADLHALVNYDDPVQSNLVVKQLFLEGTGIDLKGDAVITNILQDPHITSNIKGDLDLTTLKKKFPVSDNIEAKGLAHIDINAVFKSNDIINNNFNNLKLSGNSVFTDLLINDPKDTIYLKTKRTELVFDSKTAALSKDALGKINVTDLTLNYKNQHNVTLAGLDLKLKAKKLKDSITALGADASLSYLKYTGTDNLRSVIRKANITAELSPRSTKEKPAVKTTFTVDSAGVWQDKKFVGIKEGNYKLTLRKNDDKWLPSGFIEFNNLYAYTPDFALPLRMEHSKISINNRAIKLRNAHIFLGNSDITLSGQINNMFAKPSPDMKIDASLTLTSEFIDANEIMKVLSPEEAAPAAQPDFNQVAEDKVYKPKTVSDEKAVFKIPDNISFEFNSTIKKLHYGALDLKDLKGILKIKDGHLKLKHFELTTLAARLTTSLDYMAVNQEQAKIDFDFNLHDVEMENIAKVMPAMDSLFPMTKSFVGKADLRMQGSAMLDRGMEVIIPSINSIAALQATDIMVLDSETFKDLAKTLMFKDREKNTIQTLNMEMFIEESHMEILPALVEIDRYRLVVGGVQNLDMTYDYHVSVLKSPVPFKTGVDIRGNLADYKISLARARYKYYFTDKQRLKDRADEDIINKKKKILAKLNFD